MYLEFSIQDVDQKSLFFKISNALSLSSNEKPINGKYEGLYAIYKDGSCYYVGYSQNLASRVATHIRGKYQSCDTIRLFIPSSCLFDRFYTLNKEGRKEVLLKNEKTLMSILKPIENLNIDMDHKPDEKYCIGFSEIEKLLSTDAINHESYRNAVECELGSFVIEKDRFNNLAIFDESSLDSDFSPVINRIDREFLYFECLGKRDSVCFSKGVK